MTCAGVQEETATNSVRFNLHLKCEHAVDGRHKSTPEVCAASPLSLCCTSALPLTHKGEGELGEVAY